jgi:periplasmic protein TonB
MTNQGKSGLSLLLCAAFAAGSGLAAGRSQDQTNSPAAPSETAQPPTPPLRVRVSQGVSTGLLLKKVQPKYPEKARRNWIQGTVELRALIGKEGDIVDLTVVSGDPLLAKSAVKAVKQWKYKPYLFQGNPVEVDTQILVNFALSEN